MHGCPSQDHRVDSLYLSAGEVVLQQTLLPVQNLDSITIPQVLLMLSIAHYAVHYGLTDLGEPVDFNYPAYVSMQSTNFLTPIYYYHGNLVQLFILAGNLRPEHTG